MSQAPEAFAIEGEFSIYRAAELAAQMQAWAPNALPQGALDIDLGQVSEMDSAGLQLLLCLQQCAVNAGARFSLIAASDPVVQVLRLTALEHWLPSDTPPPTEAA